MNTDFRKYAVGHLGMSGNTLDSYMKAVNAGAAVAPAASYVNPYILEERQLNVTQLDVFSRLMMDRIIFLGTQVDETSANIIQAQLLYLDSADPGKDINIYVNSPGGSVYAGLGIYDTMQYISSNEEPQGQASDIEITARQILKLKDELYRIISDHSGQPFEKVAADSDRDYWMSAAEAAEYGMIDKVLVNPDKKD